MHSNKRPHAGSFNLKKLSAAVATALVFSNAYAAGLGKLTVLSALGQPLRAEIELTSVSKDEVGALVAKLASADAYRQASIDFSPALSMLRFAVEQRGERQFIRMTSAQPLNEPFVDMLLELSGPNGRLVREYTFLLDPADLRTTQSAQVAPAAVPEASAPVTSQPAVQPNTVSQGAPATRGAAPRRVQQAAPAPRVASPAPQMDAEPKGDASQGEYKVRNGDTLGRIAGQVKTGGVSLDQMLVALYQANPDAFVGNNMNRLKAGQILSVPSADAARSISSAEARNIVVAQSADFNAYRAKLAGQVAGAAPQKSAEGKQSAGGKITTKVEERPTPASESKDKLKLSNAAPSVAAGEGKPGSGAEDKIARDKTVAEANARVKELEKNVNDLQKLLEVKNKALSDQQKQADAAKTEAKPAAPAKAPEPKVEKPAETKVAEAKPAEVKPAETKPAEPAPAEAKAEKPAEPAAPPVAAAPPAAKPKPAAPPPPPPVPEPSFLDELLGNPLLLPGIGALLVALGGLGIYRARRQKQSKQFEDSIITDSSLKANSLFGSTGGQSVDTNNSVFNSGFAPSAGHLDSNEVDPVAEADVYIAYGRDAQAEEILKEALRTQPDRHAVRVKLLEIYSNRKDLRAFEVLATELYGLTKGEGDDWAQAASMGVAIDPNNPLYASGRKESGDASESLIAPTQPLDEQGLATLLSTTQGDTTQIESIDTLDADTSYFNNTELAADVPLEPLPEIEPEAEPERTVTSNDLDFDLDGMQDLMPKEAPQPAPVEPPADLSSIDFNFLDEPPKSVEPVPEPMAEIEPLPEPVAEPEPVASSIPPIDDLAFSLTEDKPVEESAPAPMLDDISLDMTPPPVQEAPLEIDMPSLEPEQPAPAEEQPKAAAVDPLDFDLSDISLELNSPEPAASETSAPAAESADADLIEPLIPEISEPAAPKAAAPAATESVDLPDLNFEPMDTQFLADDATVSAEMATKLDLAIAYQEIGDKEGARELLDEVLKGGTPEQSERARNLLLELA
ncbi:pilus assembly protein FimV [Herbaspirillum sp. HC18]|nr:pilus assembly protein FimV [Herbaspirillum sp. HC18]